MEAPLVAASVNVDDDVWEVPRDEPAVQHRERAALERAGQMRRAQFHDLGYRDGLEGGRNFSLQPCFDMGYRETVDAGFGWGVAKGALSAFAGLPEETQAALVRGEEARSRLQALYSRANSVDALQCYYEDRVMQSNRGCRRHEQRDLAAALRDLNISQGSTGTSECQSRLEELERQVRVELAHNALELSILE